MSNLWMVAGYLDMYADGYLGVKFMGGSWYADGYLGVKLIFGSWLS